MDQTIKDNPFGKGWNQERLDSLFLTLEPMVLSLYKKYGEGADSFEDAYQNSYEIMLKAVNSYEEGSLLPFIRYYKDQLIQYYMDQIQENEHLQALQEAVEALDDRGRWFLYHHYYQGKKIEDIAEEFGMNIQGLGKLKERVLDQLRDYMSD
ncbi:sigma-70 family RNA polymerase sigma factor [Alkalibacter rhizosphaerae]|uniref:Sigma-70 family RNA polymerase sigma factor n=1 Tax=Alkalibacter rhizosphaerae TaxID=2815577 RepID=A0A974XF94_9FIRM|nr:sigma-70 family RNA polymerase sigma factor [Alkalibacter rhizosphaerae]QSX07650.1 sigma-70 family RNA polymerase sigma factor [Alkalibacter rhizosphaerae]